MRERGLFPSEITDDDRAGLPPARRAALPLRRRSQPDGRAGGAAVALAVDAGAGPAALVSRSSARRRQQPRRRVARRPGAAAAGRPRAAARRAGRRCRCSKTTAPGAALRLALPIRARLADVPDDTAEVVRDKERLLADLDAAAGQLGALRRMADLWCACWFWPEGAAARPGAAEFGELLAAIRTGRSSLPAHVVEPRLAAGRTRVGRVTASCTGRSPSPRSSSPATGRRVPTPGSTPSSATRRGRCCAATPAARTRASDRRRESALLTRFVRQSGVYRRVRATATSISTSCSSSAASGCSGPAGGSASSCHGASRPITGSARAAAPAARSLPHRRVRRVRERAGDLPDSPWRPVPAAVRVARAPDRPRARAARRARSRSARAGAGAAPRRRRKPADEHRRVASAAAPAVGRRPRRSLGPPLRRTAPDRAPRRPPLPPLGHASGWAATFGRELNATDDRARFTSTSRRPAGDRRQARHAVPRQCSRRRRWVRSPGGPAVGRISGRRCSVRGSPIATSHRRRTARRSLPASCRRAP